MNFPPNFVFQALALTPYEFPDNPFMTTPVGVSATSQIYASDNV